MKQIFAAALAVALSAGAANAVIFDFEEFIVNTPISSVSKGGISATVATDSNRTVANGGTNQAVTFDSANPTGNDDDLASPFTAADGVSPDLSPGMILIIAGPNNGQGLPDDDLQGGKITFTFNTRVNVLGFDYFDTEAGDNRLIVSTDTLFTSAALITGNGKYGSFSTPLLGITSLTFDFGGSGALDNLNVQAVPLPAAGLLLLGALGAFGVAGRRRSA